MILSFMRLVTQLVVIPLTLSGRKEYVVSNIAVLQYQKKINIFGGGKSWGQLLDVLVLFSQQRSYW